MPGVEQFCMRYDCQLPYLHSIVVIFFMLQTVLNNVNFSQKTSALLNPLSVCTYMNSFKNVKMCVFNEIELYVNAFYH